MLDPVVRYTGLRARLFMKLWRSVAEQHYGHWGLVVSGVGFRSDPVEQALCLIGT